MLTKATGAKLCSRPTGSFVRDASAYSRKLCLIGVVCLLGYLPALSQDHTQLSSDPQKKIEQLPSLVDELPTSQDAVLAVLSDQDVKVRYEALKEITKRPTLPQPVLSSIIQLASSPDPQERSLAITCLSRAPITQQREVDVITTSLADPVAIVRLAAIKAIPTVAPSAKCTTSDLLNNLEDPEPSVQLAAVQVVKDIKCDQSAAVPILAKLSENSSSAQIRGAAIEALGNSTADIDSIAELLIRVATQEKDATLRHSAVRAIQNVKSLSSQQLISLRPITHDPSSNVRQSAAYTLIIFGAIDAEATEMVVPLQSDKDEGVRESVAYALRYSQPDKPPFLLFAKSLLDQSAAVRLNAAKSLQKLKDDKDDEANADGGPDMFSSFLPSEEALPKEFVDALLQALDRSDSLLRELVVHAIREFGVSDHRVVKRITELSTTDTDEWVRRNCVRAIGRLPTNQLILTALIKSTRDRSSVVRKSAITILGKLPSEDWPLSEPVKASASIGTIESALSAELVDRDTNVRLAALAALEALAGTYISPRLQIPQLDSTVARLRVALHDEDPAIREAAAKTLGAVRMSAPDIQVLTNALNDQNVAVATQAAKSLAEIDFYSEHAKQSTGLMGISVFDFTTPKIVVATTTKELQTVKPGCLVIEVLIASLNAASSSELRLVELQSLGSIAAHANAMVSALQEGEMPENKDFMRAATGAIEDCAPEIERAGSFVEQRLNDTDPQIRSAAVTAAGILQLQSSAVSAAIDRLSTDKDLMVRRAAISAIPDLVPRDDEERMNAAALELLTAVRDTDSEVRLGAVQGMVSLKSLDALAKAFRSEDAGVREGVLRGYATLETPLSLAEPLMVDGLRDRDRTVRTQAISYLSAQGINGVGLAKNILPLLSDNGADIRAAAAALFGYYKGDSGFAVPDLTRLLSDENTSVKIAAADSLGWIGPSARDSVSALVSLLADESVGPHAKLALEKIGIDAISQLIDSSKNSQSEKERQLAADTLDAIKSRQAEHTQALHLALKGGSEESVELQSPAVVIAVATWCPFSKRLRDFLIREDVKPYLKGINFYFLLEDETDTVAAHLQGELKEHKDWTEERKKEVLSQVQEAMATTGFFDQSFVSTLPGERLQVVALSKLGVPAFPSILDPVTKATAPGELTKKSWLSVHDWAKTDWFSGHVNMPEAMLSELKAISGGSIFGF